MGVVEFVRHKELFKHKMAAHGYTGHLASDFSQLASRIPYFMACPSAAVSKSGVHLIVCVHGLDGCSDDLRPYRNMLRLLIGSDNVKFVLSESNQQETFNDLETMSRNLAEEVLNFLATTQETVSRISFIAHSLGAVITRGALEDVRLLSLRSKLHCFLSLNGPHCGILYNQKAANLGASLVKWWKKSTSLEQLMLRDQGESIRQCYLYRLSQSEALGSFAYVLLVGSLSDAYVPLHSALVQPCGAAQRDASVRGAAYAEMVAALLAAVARSARATLLVRYVVVHAGSFGGGSAVGSRSAALLGRAPHVAVLDDDVFIDKFLLVSALRYFL